MTARSPISERAVELLKVIESTSSEPARERAIRELAGQRDADSCRMLMGVFERCMWRSTKIALIREIGNTGHARGVEFLLQLASNRDDLALGAEAVLALGNTGSSVAGEFLLTVLHGAHHPLRRETVIALTNLPRFPCEHELLALLETDIPAGLVQYVILGLARRGRAEHAAALSRFLDPASDGGPVFNAALIAAGQLGGAATLDALEALDIRYRFFADHLRSAAIERIQLRSTARIEDAIAHLLSAGDALHQGEWLQLLKHFPRGEAWEAFQLFAGDAAPTLRCLVRSALFDPQRLAEDRQFILDHATAIDREVAAALLRLHRTHGPADFLDELYRELPAATAIDLMGRVREPAALDRLAHALVNHEQPDRVNVVNAIVAQVQMAGYAEEVSARAGAILLGALSGLGDTPLAQRVLRGLGQIGYRGRDLWPILRTKLAAATRASSSIYLALRMLGGDPAAALVLQRIPIAPPAELSQALAALAAIGPLADRGPLRGLDVAALDPGGRISLLCILATNQVTGLGEFVEQSLDSADFQTRMLAIAAAERNHSPKVLNRLLAIVGEPNPCLSGRARHSLCVAGAPRHFLALIERFADDAGDDRQAALATFSTIHPEGKADYKRVVAKLDELVAGRSGVFRDQDVVTAANSLRDLLLWAQETVRPAGRVVAGPQQAAADRRTFELDQILGDSIRGYAGYGEVVKSALRNAELTHRHPELFDDRVDKSTMVVEYVKSIDLLLQERLGSHLFAGGSSGRLTLLQSRVVQLELDEESSLSRLLRDLDCQSHFTTESFPAHKLSLLVRAIVSGKILYDGQRTIDGLRAWALVLLLFGRRFTFRATAIQPMLPIRNDANHSICRTTAHLNALQGIRNDAAHRGTMLHLAQIEQIRERSFEVLSELSGILHEPTA